MIALARLGLIAVGVGAQLLSLPPGPAPLLVLAVDAPLAWQVFFDGGRHWKRWTLLHGFALFLASLYWLGEIHPGQPFGAAAALAPVIVFLGAWLRLCARGRLPLWLALGSGAVLEELLRTVWMGGMPIPSRAFAFAGNNLDGVLPGYVLSQAIAGLGAYVLVFIAGSCAGVVALIPFALQRRVSVRRLAGATAGAALAACLALLPGSVTCPSRVSWSSFAYSSEDMVLVQANIPQALKHSSDPSEIRAMFDRHLAISAAAYRAAGEGVFAVLWPETMIPWPFLSAELAARFPRSWENEVGVVRRLRTEVPAGAQDEWLLGTIYHFRRGDELHLRAGDYSSLDSIFHVRPRHAPPDDAPLPQPEPANAAWRPDWQAPLARHDKVRRVPFGEFTPLGEWLPPLRWLRERLSASIPELQSGRPDQQPFVLQSGSPWVEGRRPAQTHEVRVGTAICYDLFYPALCRGWRARGAQVLLNPANYGWFGQTAFRAQIRAVARLRACETGMGVVVAGNTGPTGFFDPAGTCYGTFQALGAAPGAPAESVAWDQTTHREGWVRGPLAWERGPATLYVRVGDLPWLTLALIVFGLALTRARPGAVGRKSAD